VAEVNFEANRNQFFPEDFRFGFFVVYATDFSTHDGRYREPAGGDGRP